MKAQTRQLFWSIINCPNVAKAQNSKCSAVLSVQQNSPIRQVPEPWSGDIDNAPVLIIGSNPAYVVNEVFPSKDNGWVNWTPIYPGGPLWSKPYAEDFFEKRFKGVQCPGTNLPYVNICFGTTLNKCPFGVIGPAPLQNGYWSTFEKYCRVLFPGNSPYDFVVTDFVHCKSSQQQGVKAASGACQSYMGQILDVFINNAALTHDVLLFGSDSVVKNRLSVLQRIGLHCLGTPIVVGSFTYKRGVKQGASPQQQSVYKQPCVFNGKPVNIYCNLPTPSGSNRAASPVSINGISIKW